MSWDVIFDLVFKLAPWVNYACAILGSLVIVGTTIDKILPDNVDKGFMTKILGIPILGSFLKALTRFSPFNFKEKK